MTILDKVKKSVPKAPRITIYGKPGVGKSTLASTFPDPLFLLTEECGLTDVDQIEPAKSFAEIGENAKAILGLEEIPFKTVVIDSISKLDQLVIDFILSKEVKASSLSQACGGYGAGFLAAQQEHRRFKLLMDKFQNRGVTVVYIGHLTSTKYKAPDMDDYDQYSIIMNHEKSREIYIDDVDCVLFCKLKSYLEENSKERNIMKSTNQRIILTGVSDAHVSKNRYGMPPEISMSFDEIAKYIPFYNTGEQK